MARGYIFDGFGNLEEELELSVDGGQTQWCEKCRAETEHFLLALSSVYGYVYACSRCEQDGAGANG